MFDRFEWTAAWTCGCCRSAGVFGPSSGFPGSYSAVFKALSPTASAAAALQSLVTLTSSMSSLVGGVDVVMACLRSLKARGVLDSRANTNYVGQIVHSLCGGCLEDDRIDDVLQVEHIKRMHVFWRVGCFFEPFVCRVLGLGAAVAACTDIDAATVLRPV